MDHSTPNLPSRDFQKTEDFYAKLGFSKAFGNDQWLILKRGSIVFEFFPHPTLDPLESWFSACLRLDDVDAFFAECQKVGIPEGITGSPRTHAPSDTGEVYMGAFIDIDGTLFRVIQN